MDAFPVLGELYTAAAAVCEGVTVADASGVDPPLLKHVKPGKSTPVGLGIL